MKRHLTQHERLRREKLDATIFAACLLAAIGAECVPWLAGMLALAWGLTIWKEAGT